MVDGAAHCVRARVCAACRSAGRAGRSPAPALRTLRTCASLLPPGRPSAMDNILRAFEKCVASMMTTEQVSPPSNLRESCVFPLPRPRAFTVRRSLSHAAYPGRPAKTDFFATQEVQPCANHCPRAPPLRPNPTSPRPHAPPSSAMTWSHALRTTAKRLLEWPRSGQKRFSHTLAIASLQGSDNPFVSASV